jgi:hypothetical protein
MILKQTSNPNLQITKHEKENSLDILSGDNPDGILGLVAQIQEYLGEKTTIRTANFVNNILKISPNYRALQQTLESLANIKISFRQVSDEKFSLDFGWIDYSTKENQERAINVEINQKLLQNPTSRDIALDDIQKSLKIVRDSLKDTLSKAKKEDDSAKEAYQANAEKLTIAEIMAKLEGGESQEAKEIVDELNAGDKAYELLIAELQRKLEENANVDVFKLETDSTLPNSTLSEADDFRKKLEGDQDPSQKFISIDEIKFALKDIFNQKEKALNDQILKIGFKEENEGNPEKEEESNLLKTNLNKKLEIIGQFSSLSDKKTFVFAIAKQFTNSLQTLNDYSTNNLSGVSTENLETFLTLKDRVERISAAFTNSKKTYEDKIRSDDNLLPRAFLFGGVDSDGKEQPGMIRYCQFLQITYTDFLKTEKIPEDLQQSVEFGLFKIDIFIELLKTL